MKLMDKASWEMRSRVSGNPCMCISVVGTRCDGMFVPWHEVGGAVFWAFVGNTNTDLTSLESLVNVTK